MFKRLDARGMGKGSALGVALDEQLQCRLEPKELVVELHLIGGVVPPVRRYSVLEIGVYLCSRCFMDLTGSCTHIASSDGLWTYSGYLTKLM